MAESGQHNDVNQMIRDRDSVLSRFGPVFRAPADLDEETFTDFLHFEHNRHWWSLHRRQEELLRHFPLVIDLVGELIDEAEPVDRRIDAMSALPAFESDLYTAILMVAHPGSRGVRSAISDSAMQRLGLWPALDADAGAGETYAAVNEMLVMVADEVGVDLWTLDALWWGAEKEHDPTKHFVKRRPVERSRAAAARRPRRGPRPSAIPAEETFVCSVCFATKPVRLSADTPGVCIDCG